MDVGTQVNQRKDDTGRAAPAASTVLGVVHRDDAGPGYFDAVIANAGFALELACFATGRPPSHPIDEYAGIVVFGGTPQVDQEDVHPWLVDEKDAMRCALDADVPLLGVCLGAQLLAEIAGGWVGPTRVVRKGWGDVTLCPEAADDPIFGPIAQTFQTVVWHQYEFKLPPAAVPLARSTTALQAFRLEGKAAWGAQFHPEVTPAEMALWVGWMRELGAAMPVSEEDLQRYLDDTERNAADQERLAQSICGGFLECAVRPRGG